jgi:hypothetical protein
MGASWLRIGLHPLTSGKRNFFLAAVHLTSNFGIPYLLSPVL